MTALTVIVIVFAAFWAQRLIAAALEVRRANRKDKP
jgi:hypothetical protein